MNSIKDNSKVAIPFSNVDENKKLPGKESRDPKFLEAAKSFEGQFIRQMISEMRKTVPKDELVGESMADDIFRGQLDDQYAESWVNQGGIGLADMIYDQLYEKYGPQQPHVQKKNGEMMGLPQGHPPSQAPVQGAAKMAKPNAELQTSRPKDILSDDDKKLFMMKAEPNGFAMRSKEPLPEAVGLRSPLSGVVLQAAALEDGRQMIVVRHDQGLVTRFVHSGDNRVKNNWQVAAGEIIAELPKAKKGELANVVFELRQAVKPE